MLRGPIKISDLHMKKWSSFAPVSSEDPVFLGKSHVIFIISAMQ